MSMAGSRSGSSGRRRSGKIPKGDSSAEPFNSLFETLIAARAIVNLVDKEVSAGLQAVESAKQKLKYHRRGLRQAAKKAEQYTTEQAKWAQEIAQLKRGAALSSDSGLAGQCDELAQSCERQLGQLQAARSTISALLLRAQEHNEDFLLARKTFAKVQSVIRPMSFIYIMAVWDAFMLDTARQILQVHPQYAFELNRKVNSEDIWQSASIEVVRSQIIADALRQLDFEPKSLVDVFNRYWGIDIERAGVSVDELKELTARRNIWVHNSGVVNKDYIELVGSPDSQYVLGDKADITQAYFARAVKALTQVGKYVHEKARVKHYEAETVSP